MSEAQAHARANDLSDSRNAKDDDGIKICKECHDRWFFLPGHKELLSCLDHCETIEDFRDYAVELQEEITNLRRAQSKMIDPDSVKRPLPVDWSIIRAENIRLELAVDNLTNELKAQTALIRELQSRLRYKEDELAEYKNVVNELDKGLEELRGKHGHG